MIVPVFHITWEQIADGDITDMEEFATQVFELGGQIVRVFDRACFTVYLPTVYYKDFSHLECTRSITEELAIQLGRNFAIFCKGVIQSGGLIVPRIDIRVYDFYMPIEGA